jgi:internalin A
VSSARYRIALIFFLVSTAASAQPGEADAVRQLETRKHIALTREKGPDSPVTHVLVVALGTDDDLKLVGRIGGLKSLFVSSKAATDAGVLASLKGSRESLDDLWLGDVPCTDEVLREVARLPRLRYLTLTGTKHTDAGLAALADAPALRDVILSGDVFGNAAAKHLARVESLRSLTFLGTRADGTGFAAFAETRLHTISLTRGQISTAGLKELGMCRNVWMLTLDKSTIPEGGLKHLAGMTELYSLSTQESTIGDAGARRLAVLPALRNLHLDDTKLTDDGLASLAGCETLTHLSVRRTKVTPAGVAAFQEALPRCKVVVK